MENVMPAATDNSSLAVNKGKKYQVALFPFNNAATNCYFALMAFITYYGSYYLIGNFVAAVLITAGMGALTIGLSTLVMGMRIFDGITDPIIGALMDKTNGRLGKFRPYMIIGNAVMAVSIMAMFFLIRPIGAGWLRWALFIVFYAIYVLGYTCQCACTKAGQNCITNDPHQRSQFIIWNMIGMIGSIVLVNLIGQGLLPMLVETIPVFDANGIPLDANGNMLMPVLDALGNQLKDPNGNLLFQLLDAAGNPVFLAGEPVYALQEVLGVQYNPAFYNILVPIVVVVSAGYTVLALIAIWKKDRPEFWGLDTQGEKAKMKDYLGLLKNNSQIRWLVLSAGMNKFASTIATSVGVGVLLYGIMMGAYNGLYIPLYALSFVFMGIFFILGAKTAGRKGQKRAVTQYTAIAILFYIVLIIMLSIWDPNNPQTKLSILLLGNNAPNGSFGISINFFTVIWIVMYGCGYGAYNCCSEMCIPMVADCTDYETYRSGNYVPGIMGTVFSFADKIVSSLSPLLTSVILVGMIPALNGKLPAVGAQIADYTGVKAAAILSFCVLPMLAWIVTLICMWFYKLTGPKLREIQAVNAVRKAAMAGGMSKEEAMKTWVTIDQVPGEFVAAEKIRKDKKTGQILPPPKENIMDKIYKKLWGRREEKIKEPSVNAIPVPAQYAGGKEIIIQAAAAASEKLFGKDSGAL